VRGLGVVTQRVCKLLRSVGLVVQVQNDKPASVYFNNGRVVAFSVLLSKRREDRANEMKIRREMKVRAAKW
jgi:hypothetical protein